MAVSENVPIVFLKGAKIYQGDSLILHQVVQENFHLKSLVLQEYYFFSKL